MWCLGVKAHFTLWVKAKIELKSWISIGAITEISPKGFTLGIMAENFNYFNLPLYGLDLAPRQQQKKKEPINLGGWFATFGANVATIKYYCLMKSTLSDESKP